MTMTSQLAIPGLGEVNFQLFHLLLLGFGAITMARLMITKESLPKSAYACWATVRLTAALSTHRRKYTPLI